MTLADAAIWLRLSTLSELMRGAPWLYPAVEIVHILGFIVLVGGVTLFDLRVLGFAQAIPVQLLGRHLLPWSLASLALVVPAGLMLFTADPQSLINNSVFLLKLALIVGAALNALLFHVGVYRTVASWNTGVAAPALARAQALLSILLWIAIISCGRLLAYV